MCIEHKMKVLFVAHCNDLSGANKSFLSLIKTLKDKMDIVVLCNQYQGGLTDSLDAIGIQYIKADYAWWYIRPRNKLFKQLYRRLKDSYAYKKKWLTASLLEQLKRENFEIVYTNTSTIDAGIKIAEKLEIPHVWHVREFGQEDFGLIPMFPCQIYQQTFEKSNKIIVISEALKKKYASYIDDGKLVKIYNGFEVEKMLCNSAQHDLSKRINIIVTGQVCSGKGQIQAIEAVYKLYSNGYPIHLYIAGEVDDTYLKPILTKYSNYEEWLSILGCVEDMYILRKQMDIELVCSRCEAFGRVTLEAMLHSIPVIGSKAGGTPELINDHETGLLFEYGNVDELVSCIKELCNNQKLYSLIMKNAKNYATAFTIQKTADLVFEVFKSIGNDKNE